MRDIDRRSLFLVTTAAMTFATEAARATESTPLGLDGTWVGELTPISGPGLSPPPRHFGVIRLEIDGLNVRVFSDDREPKPGLFTINRHGSNAVITAIQADPGAPVGASWVETWTFIVTVGDPSTLIVNYVRVVNNNQSAMTEDGARFSQIRTGQLRRPNV
jgi:hypothetical protein